MRTEHEQLIWSELMKLPRCVLQAMADELMCRLPDRLTIRTASNDDLATALSRPLAKRDFLRGFESVLTKMEALEAS